MIPLKDLRKFGDIPRAMRIVREYAPDLENLSEARQDSILAAVRESNNFDDLDINLDRVMTGHSLVNIGGGTTYTRIDIDSGGYYSNARKSLEG